jgi:hypothetical protein
MRNKKRLTYEGTDKKTYRGKSIKPRKRLERRIKNWETICSRLRGASTAGFKCPGSMSK